MITSIVTRADVGYPRPEGRYSPSERYPEYRFDHLDENPNHVYSMVREVFAQAGLDRERLGTAEWNPLGRYIKPGSSVFVLCNFVYHRRPSESQLDFDSKCTHGSVLRAVLDYVLLATGPRGRVRFGNSSLQSCNWEAVLSDTGADRVAAFYRDQGIDVQPTDLRLYVAARSALGRVVRVERREAGDSAVEVNLGEESLLHELSRRGNTTPRFRISDYDPRRISAYHADGSHRYVIGRPCVEADTILCLPTLKTHEKVGITCALKGYVGMVGHKDCLAHHRFGGPGVQGDEFPSGGWILTPMAHFHDWLNRRPDGALLNGGFQVLDRAARKAARMAGLIMSGAWHGNDTAWRMALDLARLACYLDANERMRNVPQRTNIAFLDGIISGEGQGPLSPSPVRAGTVLFSDDVVQADRIACRLMGFDPDAIPIVARARALLESAPDRGLDGTSRLIQNGESLGEDRVRPVLGRPFRAPRGWREHL